MYSAKNAQNYAPHYAFFFFYILLSHLLSSAQIVSSIQKGNTKKPIELRGRVVTMPAESGLNLRPNRSHTAISVTLVKPN